MSKRTKRGPSRAKGRGRSQRTSSLRKAKAQEVQNKGRGKLLRGKVQKNPRGFAFIVPAHAEFEDAFVSQSDATELLDGDTVEFRLVRKGPRASARIEKIVQRRTTRVVGQVDTYGPDPRLITPNNEVFAIGDGGSGLRSGEWVVAELDEGPRRSNGPLVNVMETFGASLTPRHDYAFTIARYGLSDSFPKSVLREEKQYREWAAEEFANPEKDRRDHRPLPYITIDGEDAKDFDDAIFVEQKENARGFILYVSIADVAFFVRPGTALDKEAHARATSVYFPGYCLPMLPEFLSNDLCSLRPREDKLSMTAEIHFSSDGVVQESHFYSSRIKTAHRMTYTQVQAVFDKDPATLQEFRDIVPHLKNANLLFRALEKQRRQRGVLDFDLPEAKIEVDPQGRPTSVKRAPRYTAHKLIEEFMIAANRAVARELRERKAPALYRVHEAPEATKLEELNMLLRTLGSSEKITEVSPKAFARVLAATAELPAAGTVHQFVLRLQQQARYMPLPKGHFGLALADYAHFTSPIRRYPDLVVHRALKALKSPARRPDKRTEEPENDGMVELGEHTSNMERRATEAERFIVKRKQCWYFLDRVGDFFDGTVGGVTKNGVFVSLGEMAAEGFVPLEYLDGFYEYDQRSLCLRRRPGPGVLSMGDPIRVQVVEVKVDENQITLGMAKDE